MSQKQPVFTTAADTLRILQERPGHPHMLHLVPGDRGYAIAFEQQDLGVGEGHEEGGVGGDDELAAFGDAGLQERHQGEDAERGEGGLGFVEEIEAVRDQAALEEGEEGLAVGAGVGVFAVGLGERAALAGGGAHGQASSVVALDGVGEVVLQVLEVGLVGGDALDEAEDVLGPQEEAGAGVAFAGEAVSGGEGAGRGEAVVCA